MTSPSQPRLAVHEGGARRVVLVDRPVFRIGRAAESDLQLGGPDISREHALLITDADGYLLRDRSRAGTFVNGEAITDRRIVHGDEIECGRSGTVLMFLVTPPAEERSRGLQASDLRPIAALLESLRAMGGERVLDEVLATVLDAAITTSAAERGFIMLASASGHLDMQMARGAGQVTLPAGAGGISQKIPEQVFTTGQGTAVADLLEGDLATVHTGTVALGIRHVLCVPLRVVRYVERTSSSATAHNIGVLYLDSRARGHLLSDAARADIEALAGEAAAAIESARLYQEALEKATIDRELEMASRIQRALLPEPRRSGPFFEAVGASIPSRTVGGDFFDYQDMPDGALGLAIGDITGKGPPAALLTALVQGLLAADALAGRPPDHVVAAINRVLLARPIESRFLSIFLSVLGSDGRLDYCNAGQNPPLLFSGHTVTRLETGGTLVGAFTDATFERGTVGLKAGDTLLLYSDGVNEAENRDGEDFGETRIRETVVAVSTQPPQQVLDTLFARLREFTNGTRQHDDMTAVVVRYR